MNNFEYAQPTTEAEAIKLLADKSLQTTVLAGGTDLVGLMKRMVVTPDRVVNICEVESLQQIEMHADGSLWIGAAVKLDTVLDNQQADSLPSVKQVIQGISSVQLQAQGTLVGEILRRPTCWYFRNGHGLLGDSGRMVATGDNRYHAILGNRGPAKFVNASRLAPALISLGAKVRVIGPEAGSEQFMDLEHVYRSPKADAELETVLQPGQLVTHVIIPSNGNRLTAAYEIRHGEGPDQPLAAAAVSLDVTLGRVSSAKVVLGQVAPVPWVSAEAARSLQGSLLTEEAAAEAGRQAVVHAMPLSQNEYKIQLARVAVKRAILRAAGLETGGLDCPSPGSLTQQPQLV